MTFEQVADTVKNFSPEQREILTNLIHRWQIESTRREIAKDAKESLIAFRSGQLKPQSAKAIIMELQKAVKNQK
ncbi:MAG: hypothetical protein JRJ49_02415 [Deltaproteobacteria bacterium]|nr:hypothetical protein [Deltaproteobacteria bacterium]